MYGKHYIGANDTYALDSAQDNKLVFAIAEDLTADRQLDWVVGDANRKIDLTPTADYGLLYDSASSTWMAKDIVATLTAIFKTDGSRDVTGQITSTFAAGAPFVVADSTVVTSLNADLLDGSHASAFALVAHTHTFLNLTDVPASYAGQALKLVRVNAGATALEFSAAVTTTFLALTDSPATYASQASKVLMVNVGETAVEFLGPWLDQDVRVAATPTFGGLTVDGNVTFTNCSTLSISDSPGNTAVTMDGTLSVASTCNIVGLFTANQQIVSTLADGTKPLAVTSLTLCDNLNVDMVDGAHVGTSGAAVPLLNTANTWSDTQLFAVTTEIHFTSSANRIFADSPSSLTCESSGTIKWYRGVTPMMVMGSGLPGADKDFLITDGATGVVSFIGIDELTEVVTAPDSDYFMFWDATDATHKKALLADIFTPFGIGALSEDGSVPLIANWDAGGFDIRALTFESDVASGTAPFVVASVTVVSNLNVDQVDGADVGTSGATIPLLNAANTWSAAQLFATTTEIQLDSSSQYLKAVSSTQVMLNAASTLFLAIGGSAEVLITANDMMFDQGIAQCGMSWGSANVLHFRAGATDQVKLTDGSWVPVLTNDIELGTSSLEWKSGRFVGTVQASGFLCDGDAGGAAGTISLTNVTVSPFITTPTFIKLPSGYAAAQAKWIKIREGTTATVLMGWQ